MRPPAASSHARDTPDPNGSGRAAHAPDTSGTPAVAWLEGRRLGRRFHARNGDGWWEQVALEECSFRIRTGQCVLVTGPASAPCTALALIAGLIRPGTGVLCWCDGQGRRVPPPARRFIGATWRPHACLSVRDTLEAAVSRRTWQRNADRLIDRALHQCALHAAAGLRMPALDADLLARLAVAVALVGGARWILLEISGPLVSDWRPLLRWLAGDGVTLIVAGNAAMAAALRPARVIRVHGQLPTPLPAASVTAISPDCRRVAEAARPGAPGEEASGVR